MDQESSTTMDQESSTMDQESSPTDDPPVWTPMAETPSLPFKMRNRSTPQLNALVETAKKSKRDLIGKGPVEKKARMESEWEKEDLKQQGKEQILITVRLRESNYEDFLFLISLMPAIGDLSSGVKGMTKRRFLNAMEYARLTNYPTLPELMSDTSDE